jgi:hypothetical protein
MEKSELLAAFQSRVDQFEAFQAFIEKARAQAGKFSAAVVEKVISDNEAKSLGVVQEIIPLIGDMEQVAKDLSDSKESIINGRQDSQFKLEELELRLAIGAMTDEEFEASSADLKEALGSIDGQVAELDGELEHFQGALDRWNTLGVAAGVLKPEPEPEPEPEAELEELSGEGESDDADLDEETGGADLLDVEVDAAEDDGGVHAERVQIADDLSDVFADDGDADDVIEVDEGSDVDLDEGGEIDIFGDDEVAADEGDEQRRAVLLYQEGTAEEQIYPFNGEVMTLGRGRDNDIQVKNDSKVSRYHCKLYRRGPNFYIEDNKSANGTLVNGELITERRLFGGEEIIIGETFFRFRIMD